ncbi:hypothetical protein L3X38_029552 [Prunus dulcis]|uniref:U1-type domain-containing protein n=1 Tax=Prunus dulcis TaxID=3755 RepID=A0AAD4VTE1_PRUDU|nr:hypothetical protein L3X38_029552 [Prunus dulcis]
MASLVAPNVGPYFAAVQSEATGIWSKDPNKMKLVQFAWCEVCKVNCNSNDTYIKHLVGKKHQKNLEQLEKLKNDGSASTSNVPSTATNAIIEPMETQEPRVPSQRRIWRQRSEISYQEEQQLVPERVLYAMWCAIVRQFSVLILLVRSMLLW